MEQSQTNPSRSSDLSRQNQNQGFVDQIKSELVQFSAAFSKADVNTAATFFAPDATLINPLGIRATGREQIARVMHDDMTSILKGGRSDFKYESSRMLSDDLAFVDILMNVTGMKSVDGKEIPMSMHVVSVMRKMGDRWFMLETRPYQFLPTQREPIH